MMTHIKEDKDIDPTGNVLNALDQTEKKYQYECRDIVKEHTKDNNRVTQANIFEEQNKAREKSAKDKKK